MAHEEGLPGIGDSQEIGQDATRCLHTNAPLNWVTPKDLGGTDDYGLDFQVQLKAKSQAAAIFRLQLKGTRGPDFIEKGKFISISLSASTLRYYSNIAEPTMVAASFAGIWFLKAKLRDEAQRPPLSMLAQLTLMVASLSLRAGGTSMPDAPRRLLQVFMHLVELEFGDRMD